MWDSLGLDFEEKKPEPKEEEAEESLKGRRLHEKLDTMLREEALKSLRLQKQK